MTNCIYCGDNSPLPVCVECDEKNKQKILTRKYVPTGIFTHDWVPRPGIIIPPKDKDH